MSRHHMRSGRRGSCVKEASSFWGRFWSDESGSAAAEYVVILAVIGTAVALSVIVLSGAIEGPSSYFFKSYYGRSHRKEQ